MNAKWEYGFYDTYNPAVILWSNFGGLVGFDTAESARHTADRNVWGEAVIVRRRGHSDFEVVPE